MLEELKQKTFANEAEEAEWWESHEDDLAAEFEKAGAEGGDAPVAGAVRAQEVIPAS